jgi:hypothetical protein
MVGYLVLKHFMVGLIAAIITIIMAVVIVAMVHFGLQFAF